MAAQKRLELWGNDKTMNLEAILARNLQSSTYFKGLLRLRSWNEVIDEIKSEVKTVEPWTIAGGSRNPSTAFCLLFKLYTLKITEKQMTAMLNYKHSPFVRALGFLFLRYAHPPKNLWDWFEGYLEDDEEISLRGPRGEPVQMGKFVRDLLLQQKYFDTILPRIPVPIMKEIEQKLDEHDKEYEQYNNDNNNNEDRSSRSRSRSPRRSPIRDRSPPRRSRSRDRRRSRSRSRDRYRNRRSRSRSRDRYRDRSPRRSRSRDRSRRSRSRSPRYRKSRSKSPRDRYRDRRSRSPRDRRRSRSASPRDRRSPRKRSRSPSPDTWRKRSPSPSPATTNTTTSSSIPKTSIDTLKALYGAHTASTTIPTLHKTESHPNTWGTDTITIGLPKKKKM